MPRANFQNVYNTLNNHTSNTTDMFWCFFQVLIIQISKSEL